MKKLILILITCIMCLGAQGQRVDFSSYERVFHQGKVSIVRQDLEYRLIVGSLKNPRISLLLGSLPELAVGNMNRIVNIAKNQPEAGSSKATYSIVFCGEPFSITITGPSSNRKVAFKGMTSSARFSLSKKDIDIMIQSILE